MTVTISLWFFKKGPVYRRDPQAIWGCPKLSEDRGDHWSPECHWFEGEGNTKSYFGWNRMTEASSLLTQTFQPLCLPRNCVSPQAGVWLDTSCLDQRMALGVELNQRPIPCGCRRGLEALVLLCSFAELKFKADHKKLIGNSKRPRRWLAHDLQVTVDLWQPDCRFCWLRAHQTKRKLQK